MRYVQLTIVSAVILASFSGQVQEIKAPDQNMLRLPDNTMVKQMAITNRDYKLFRPEHKYDQVYEQYPAIMTKQEAEDYAAWAGKKMGEDLISSKRIVNVPGNRGRADGAGDAAAAIPVGRMPDRIAKKTAIYK